MLVRVTCMKNNHRVIYNNCTEIEHGAFWDDDTTATFRNGFLIEVYANEWEYNNGYRRIKICV